MFAHRLSKFLSRLALIAVMVGFACTHFQYPPIGYEGVVFISSVCVALAIGAALLALILAGLLLLRRQPPRPYSTIVTAALALALAFTYIWLL